MNNLFFEVCLVCGLFMVILGPSPYYAAFGLVVSSGVGCYLLMTGGITFLCMVLFLIYLGGMMVVFAYAAALVGEPFPEMWKNKWFVLSLVVLLILFGLWSWKNELGDWTVVEWGVVMYSGDWFGPSVMFTFGGGLLVIMGWSLLLTLLGVFEVVRGRHYGTLRAV